MISLVRRIVKASPLYPALREWRDTKALREWGPNDQARLDFYRQLIQPNDLVFDIGANVGNRTKVFLRLGARVVAFEPQSSCAAVLQKALSNNPSFRLARKALGDKPGVAELRIGAAHDLSTLSGNWIDAMLESGRFGNEKWKARELVNVTTFDEAIQEFGEPVFSKIDVEGFEPHVMAGLSLPLQSGSLEFAAEALDGTIWCLERLAGFQPYVFQFSAAETMRFDWESWMDLAKSRDVLAALARIDRRAWGDVYFRREAPRQTAAVPQN